jgi:hypothetical protein
MRKVILILGGVAVVALGSSIALALYQMGQKDKEVNRKRTEKARETRLENLRNPIENSPENNFEPEEKLINTHYE